LDHVPVCSKADPFPSGPLVFAKGVKGMVNGLGDAMASAVRSPPAGTL
jgi:hypothetical protein